MDKCGAAKAHQPHHRGRQSHAERRLSETSSWRRRARPTLSAISLAGVFHFRWTVVVNSQDGTPQGSPCGGSSPERRLSVTLAFVPLPCPAVAQNASEAHLGLSLSPCYAALRPNPRRCRVPRSVRPDARKTPLHRHRPGLSQAWRSRRLCDRRPRSLGRRARTQLHVRSRTTAILARRAFDDAPTRPLKGVTDAPLGRRPANRTLTRRQVRRYRAARRSGLDAVAVRLARRDAVRAADRLSHG